MKKRIFGIETEYGLLIKEKGFKFGPVDVALQLKDYIFQVGRKGLLDQHYRANDEPPGNGGFLTNGGRIYLDMGHLEYASPECSNLVDLITYDRGGDMLIQEAVEKLGWEDKIAIIKNNVDLETNATFGCHENYLVSRDFKFENRHNLRLLSSFLVTRQIYCGAGRIGSCNPHPFRDWSEDSSAKNKEEQVDFQISQRADHIPNEFYRWVQYNRAIVNTRDEPLSDPGRFRRVHLLVGDSNMNEYSNALKMGTTILMMDLIELGVGPTEWMLDDAVGTMRKISRDSSFRWEITLSNGQFSTALDLQMEIMETAKKYLSGSGYETDWILTEWESVLNDLSEGFETVIDRVDWAAKYWMLNEFRKEKNISWQDPWIKSLDLEYHNLNKNDGLFWCLEGNGDARRKTSDDAVKHSMVSAPRGTRALGRGELVKSLIEYPSNYLIDWIGFRLNKEEPFLMLDPFDSYREEVKGIVKQLRDQEPTHEDGLEL